MANVKEEAVQDMLSRGGARRRFQRCLDEALTLHLRGNVEEAGCFVHACPVVR